MTNEIIPGIIYDDPKLTLPLIVSTRDEEGNESETRILATVEDVYRALMRGAKASTVGVPNPD